VSGSASNRNRWQADQTTRPPQTLSRGPECDIGVAAPGGSENQEAEQATEDCLIDDGTDDGGVGRPRGREG